MQRPMTVPSSTLSAANGVIVWQRPGLIEPVASPVENRRGGARQGDDPAVLDYSPFGYNQCEIVVSDPTHIRTGKTSGQ